MKKSLEIPTIICRNRIKKLTILILMFSFSQFISAQNVKNTSDERRPFSERISIGGALGFGFGSNSVLVDVSPIIGYAVANNLVLGVGLTYKYYQLNDYYYNIDNLSYTDSKNNIYGGSVFARYFFTGIDIPVIENMYVHTEIEPLIFTNDYTLDPGGQGAYLDPYGNSYSKGNEQITITSYFLGGGLRQMIGDRSYMYIEALWNFNEELYTPYSNPRIRIGVAVGF
jgi:hypothetical protein